MIFGVFFDFILPIIVLCVLVTQVFVPLIFGTPIFPLLRRKDLTKALEDANEDVLRAEIEAQIQHAHQLAEETRKKAHNDGVKIDG